MKFIVSKHALETEIKSLSKVINKKSTLPILTDFMFQVKEQTLIIMASDAEIWVQTQVHVDENTGGDGTFCLPVEELTHALRQLAEQPVTILVDVETQHCEVTHSSGQFTFLAEASDEYPKPKEVDAVATEISIEVSTVRNALARSIFACADDELRPVMNGVYFDFLEDKTNIVASNGHILIRNTEYGVAADHPAAFIMPKKVAKFLLNSLGKDGLLSFRFDDYTCIATYDSTSVIFRLIEGRYPNYNSVIPQKTKHDATVDRLTLSNGLKRVNPFSNESSNLIRFQFEADKLTLDAEDFDFSKTATERIACSFDGKTMAMGFKGKSIVEILSVLSAPEVVIRLTDPSHVALIIPNDDDITEEEITCLLMPMLINE